MSLIHVQTREHRFIHQFYVKTYIKAMTYLESIQLAPSL